MTDTSESITHAFHLSHKFDEGVREAMTRALRIEEKKDDPKEAGYAAVAMLACDVAVSFANVVMAIRKPDSGRSFRMAYDLVIGLNSNLFWSKHAAALMPLLHSTIMDHLDSVMLQDERGEVKVSPYDQLIMGAEAAPMALFSMLLFLVGGPFVQMQGSVMLKKELMPLLMR